MKEFGQYGSSEGEFDCLAGVSVNRIGQYIIADRYNHRIQVCDIFHVIVLNTQLIKTASLEYYNGKTYDWIRVGPAPIKE